MQEKDTAVLEERIQELERDLEQERTQTDELLQQRRQARVAVASAEELVRDALRSLGEPPA